MAKQARYSSCRRSPKMRLGPEQKLLKARLPDDMEPQTGGLAREKSIGTKSTRGKCLGFPRKQQDSARSGPPLPETCPGGACEQKDGRSDKRPRSQCPAAAAPCGQSRKSHGPLPPPVIPYESDEPAQFDHKHFLSFDCLRFCRQDERFARTGISANRSFSVSEIGQATLDTTPRKDSFRYPGRYSVFARIDDLIAGRTRQTPRIIVSRHDRAVQTQRTACNPTRKNCDDTQPRRFAAMTGAVPTGSLRGCLTTVGSDRKHDKIPK